MNYIVKGFNNTILEQYEHTTFTLTEAICVAEYFHTHYGCDFVVVQDIATNRFEFEIWDRDVLFHTHPIKI